jgi:hypothetical protein
MQSSYDVAVIGGAIAGASTAFLLKRKTPSLRILIIEKTQEFDRKVGESTSEVGACFLMRVLNLAGHLGQEQITKSGLRMWFYRDSNECFTRCGEIGPKHQTRVPACGFYQRIRAEVEKIVMGMERIMIWLVSSSTKENDDGGFYSLQESDCVWRRFYGPKGQDRLAQALAWVFRFIVRGPEGARDALEPNVESNSSSQADGSFLQPRAVRHPSLPPPGDLLYWTPRPEIRCPFSISNPVNRAFFIERTFMCLVGPTR